MGNFWIVPQLYSVSDKQIFRIEGHIAMTTVLNLQTLWTVTIDAERYVKNWSEFMSLICDLAHTIAIMSVYIYHSVLYKIKYITT